MYADDTKVQTIRLNRAAHHCLKRVQLSLMCKICVTNVIASKSRGDTATTTNQTRDSNKTADNELRKESTLPTQRHHCSKLDTQACGCHTMPYAHVIHVRCCTCKRDLQYAHRLADATHCLAHVLYIYVCVVRDEIYRGYDTHTYIHTYILYCPRAGAYLSAKAGPDEPFSIVNRMAQRKH
jgi:hypothetical protein